MSFSGELEDIPVPDILQFIHMGGRTGTLRLSVGGEATLLGFHGGRIVRAARPGAPRLGELLVEAGLLEVEALHAALALQAAEGGTRSLGQILLQAGSLTGDQLTAVVSGQISRIVEDVVGCRRGSFEFLLDDLRPIDDLALFPGEMVPQLDLDTQMVLLEALRLFDERHRAQPEDAAVALAPAPPPVALVRAQPVALPEALAEPAVPATRPALATVAPPRARLQVVTRDRALFEGLEQALRGGPLFAAQVTLRDAGLPPPGEGPPLLLLDLREGAVPLEAVVALRRTRARAPLLVVQEPAEGAARAYEAGALAVLPADPATVAACARSVAQGRAEREAGEPERAKGHLGRLRRVLGDLQSGLISTSVSLSLMNVISESAERAVLFLVKRDELVALGAFGASPAGRPLAQLTRALRLGLSTQNALTACYSDRRVRVGEVDGAALPDRFVELIGVPRSRQFAVFPVLGGRQAIAVVYVDNGGSGRLIDELELIEVASAQAGLAFENELLRRQLAGR